MLLGFCAFLGKRSIEWRSGARIEMSPEGCAGSCYIGGLCIDTKLGNGPRALLWPNTTYYGGRFGFVVYNGHKETTAQLYGEQKGPEGGGGTPGGDGETELNRPPIPLPHQYQATNSTDGD